MNNRPLYENLDTSFVNLSALVRYLRHREFIGQIKIELNNYQAEIALNQSNKIGVREHDKISGRIAEGEEAFQRILIRAREAGGTIHVYQKVGEVGEVKKVEGVKEVKEEKEEVVRNQVPIKIASGNAVQTPKKVEAFKTAVASATPNGTVAKIVKAPEMPKKPQTLADHLKLPFELSNKFENKARSNKLTDQDWQTLLSLMGELLGTIDKTLAEAKLDFKSAFSKARSEISADYPFLSPATKLFEYKEGKAVMSEQVSAKLFVTGIIEALRKILDKLGANPKFAEVYRNTVQKILALLNQRQAYYDKFSITPQLKKVLGI
jgi:hypothetical protein